MEVKKLLTSVLGIGAAAYAAVYFVGFCLFDCDLELAICGLFGKSPRKLKGKVVFITGASSGIGEHLAIVLAKHGVKLVLSARRRHELERVKQICLAKSNGQLESKDVLVVVMDVLDVERHREHFETALNHFGTIDILVNNAGRSQRAQWETTELDVDRQMFELNVFAVVNLSRVAVKYFNKKGSGHVAVVSSLAGVLKVPFSGTYVGTKHAIHGYFNALRVEKMGENLTVTLLCPGPTHTNFLSESFTEKEGEKYNVSVKETDRRMTAERCGKLCAIALANKLNESWIGVFPTIPITYLAVYWPVLCSVGMRMVGPSWIHKLREGRNTGSLEGKRSD